MVVKSLTRKTTSFKQLLTYMFRDTGQGKGERASFILKQNIEGETVKEWVNEFKENEAARLIHRSDSVKVFHEILSFHKADKELTMDKLQDIGRQYLSIRSENALAIAVPHQDKDHIHLHCMISGVEIKTGKSVRVSRDEFRQIKEQVQAYQLEKYPELSRSVVNHSKPKKLQKKEREFQFSKRTKALSDKEQTQRLLTKLYRQSLSQGDFCKRAKEAGLVVYERNGKPAGILGERKIRFSTLGFDNKKLEALDQAKAHLQEIESLRSDSQSRNNPIEQELDIEENEEEKDTEKEPDEIEEPDGNEEEQDSGGDNPEVDEDLDISDDL